MKKLLIGTSCTILTLAVLLVTFILYPNNLFARRTVYKEFTIYSNTAIKGDYKVALDKARAIVQTSELYDGNYEYDIFLTNGSFYKTVSFKIFGAAPARSQGNNVLLNVAADFEQDLLIGPKNKRDLTNTIAHEIIHCLQAHKYGLRTMPEWKREGYAEYIARQGEADFSANLQRLKTLHDEWVEVKPGQFDRLVYFKGWLMMEYLIGIRHMTFDQVLSDDVKEDEVYDEMMKYNL